MQLETESLAAGGLGAVYRVLENLRRSSASPVSSQQDSCNLKQSPLQLEDSAQFITSSRTCGIPQHLRVIAARLMQLETEEDHWRTQRIVLYWYASAQSPLQMEDSEQRRRMRQTGHRWRSECVDTHAAGGRRGIGDPGKSSHLRCVLQYPESALVRHWHVIGYSANCDRRGRVLNKFSFLEFEYES